MESLDVVARRDAAFAKLTESALDVLIVGGGIVGAGVARDAALRGLRVGLIEQHDVAYGTSSRSSRLLHGGLRYLAQGRLGLVYEASHEKRVLHNIARHLSDPLPFLFPTYRGTQWPRWQLSIGVKIYDLLCGGRNLGPSQTLDQAGTLARVPAVRPEGLTGAVRYFDGLTNDARLVIDTLRSADAAGATVVNYARLEAAQPRGSLWECSVRDVLADRTLTLASRVVVNATGPWSDRLPQSAIRLRLTKGVHLVVDRQRFSVPDAVVMTEGSRILFAIPWGERVILGTTDTDYDDAPENVRTTPDDVTYVLGIVNATFPSAKLTPGDVLSSWSGLRPLVADSRGRPSDISRRHEILCRHAGWIDVAGGKLTTYRLIAEQTVDMAFRQLKRRSPPCLTAELPLLKSPGHSGILPPPVTAEVVRDVCREEWAVHLDDLLLRRTGWHYYQRDREQVAQQTLAWMSETLGWDAARQAAELDRYRQVE